MTCSPARPQSRATGRLGASAALAVLMLVGTATGCSDERQRPSPTGPGADLQLNVELLAPTGDNTAVAGDIVEVQVHASEPGGYLHRIGYVVRRHVEGRPTVDSAVVVVGPVDDTTHTFQAAVPDSMPNNAQLDFVGLAFGPDTTAAASEQRSVIVVQCTENASWC